MTAASESARKNELRAMLRNRRAGIGAEQRREWTSAALAYLSDTRAWQRARTIALYCAIGSEIDPAPLASTDQQRIVLPRAVADGHMGFHTLHDDMAWERGPGGIRQPAGDTPVVAATTIDLVVIPLLACDERGQRLGYGGGYYDRFLAQTRGLRVGLGFALQRLDEPLPSEAHDQVLDMFVCEAGIETFTERALSER